MKTKIYVFKENLRQEDAFHSFISIIIFFSLEMEEYHLYQWEFNSFISPSVCLNNDVNPRPNAFNIISLAVSFNILINICWNVSAFAL